MRDTQRVRFALVLVLAVIAALGAAREALGLPARMRLPSQESAPAPRVRAGTTPLDINTASPAELRTLPGMGDAYVRRILEGRPYTAKSQLVTRGILPQPAYSRIRDLIVAHRDASNSH